MPKRHVVEPLIPPDEVLLPIGKHILSQINSSLANLNLQSSVLRMLKKIGSGIEGKIQELSAALDGHRRAFLDHAVITTEITAFQILNDVGSISAKVDGMSTRLEWVSSQVLDAGM